jgi:hypothetical protein
MTAVATKRRGKKAQEEPNVHTSAFCRDLTAAAIRVLEKLGASSPDNHIRSPFFRDQLVSEIESRIDWHEVRARLASKRRASRG